jgi:hypothetical protein
VYNKRVAKFFVDDTRPLFLSSFQKDPTLEYRKKYSGIYPESNFDYDSKYIIKNSVPPTQINIGLQSRRLYELKGKT